MHLNHRLRWLPHRVFTFVFHLGFHFGTLACGPDFLCSVTHCHRRGACVKWYAMLPDAPFLYRFISLVILSYSCKLVMIICGLIFFATQIEIGIRPGEA